MDAFIPKRYLKLWLTVLCRNWRPNQGWWQWCVTWSPGPVSPDLKLTLISEGAGNMGPRCLQMAGGQDEPEDSCATRVEQDPVMGTAPLSHPGHCQVWLCPAVFEQLKWISYICTQLRPHCDKAFVESWSIALCHHIPWPMEEPWCGLWACKYS